MKFFHFKKIVLTLKTDWAHWLAWLTLAGIGTGLTVLVINYLSRWVGDLASWLDLDGLGLESWSWFSRTLTALIFVLLSLTIVLNPRQSWRWFGRHFKRWLRSPGSQAKFRAAQSTSIEAAASAEVEEIKVEQAVNDSGLLLPPASPPLLLPKKPVLAKPYSRRLFLMQSGFVTTFALNSFYFEPLMPQVNRFKLKIRNLPAAFENFTIAHVTDIHVHSYATPEVVAAFVNAVNALKPDLTVVTGDFVTRGNHFFEMAAQTLGKLGEGARLGAYGVTGNHDHWADWRELSKMQPLFNKYGLPLLRDTATELWLNGETLWLVGVDDSYTENDDLKRAIGAMGLRTVEQAGQDSRPKILLTHTPEFAEKAAPAGFELMLCGHTHGGQFYVPGITETALANFPYLRGLYNLDDMQIYVNSGHGTVGPPLRFMTRPEIALITLIPETSSS